MSALAIFERAYTCKPAGILVVRAYAAACNSGNATAARHWFAQIDPAKTASLAPICTRNGIPVP